VKQQHTPGNVAGRSYNPLIFALTLTSVYLFWGGTFLAMKFALETIPVFLMVAARAIIAGFLLYGSCRLSGQARPAAIEWRNGAIVGALLLCRLQCHGDMGGAVGALLHRIGSSGDRALWIASYSSLPSCRSPALAAYWAYSSGCAALWCGVEPGEIAAHSLNLFGIFALLFASLSWSTARSISRTARMPRRRCFPPACS
jgi:hypothetical protein